MKESSAEEVIMARANCDILEALRLELNFVREAERLGFLPTLLLKRGSLFPNSPICPNFGKPNPSYPCSHCPLIDFVPADCRSESLPCQQIPLNASGDTLAMIGTRDKQYKLYQGLKDWLQTVIGWLEQDRADNEGVGALLLHGRDEPLGPLGLQLKSLGVHTLHTSTCQEAVRLLEGVNRPPLLFTEPIVSDGTWSDVLDLLSERRIRASVVVVSCDIARKLAIDVVERGAFDCLVSPVDILSLAHIVRCAVWRSYSGSRPATRAANA
jgi:hypothetical protein